MDDSIDIYWTKRLERWRKALEGNGFEAFVAREALHAFKTYDFMRQKAWDHCWLAKILLYSKGTRRGTGMNCPKAPDTTNFSSVIRINISPLSRFLNDPADD